MSERLTRGWTLVKVREVGSVQLGRQRSPDVHRGANMRPYLRVANVYEDRIDLSDVMEMHFEPREVERYELKVGDILLNEGQSRELVGRPAMYRGELPGACFTNSLVRFQASDVLDRKYALELFRHWLKSGFFQSIAQITTNIAHLGAGRFADLDFPLPPLNEQRRIVAKLEALQARSRRAREALDAVPPLLEKLRQSILAAAFRGDLTKDWRAKHKDVEPASELLKRIRAERKKKWEEAELAKMKAKGKPPTDDKWKAKYKEPAPVDATGLPDTWTTARLDVIAGVIDPNPSHRMPTYVANGVRLISSENFDSSDGIDFSIGKSVTEQTLAEQQSRYSLRDGDFALSRIGTIGKTRFLPTTQNFCISHALVVIQPCDGVNARFLRLMVASDALLMQARAGVQSVGVPDLGMDKIRAFTIPLPPRAEQNEVVTQAEVLLATAASLAKRLQETLTNLTTLDRAVLAHAFRGELVPQDPNDEPAEVMLARERGTTNGVGAASRSAERKTRTPRGTRGARQDEA